MLLRTLVYSLMFVPAFATAQASHFGIFYSYGTHFNLHPTNKHPFSPSDGSSFGAFYHLNNGTKKLGFRAAFSFRWNDLRFEVQDNTYIINNIQAMELKLQTVLQLTSKNGIALGIAPRMVTHTDFSHGYRSKVNGTIYDQQHTIAGVHSELNALNSALCLSWYHHFSKYLQFAVHADQDMLPFFRENVTFPGLFADPTVAVNGRLTSITGSLILNVR